MQYTKQTTPEQKVAIFITMPHSDTLYSLMQCLSQSEKRYLRLYVKRFRKGGTNLCSTLLGLVLGQSAKDEKRLQAQWEALGYNLSNFAVQKHYLLGLALQAMRDFRRGNIPRKQVEDLLADAEFLYERGLLAEAEKVLAKARKLAIRYELSANLLQVEILARTLALRRPPEESLPILEKLEISTQKALTMEQAIAKSHICYARLTALARSHFRLRNPEVSAEIEALQKDPELTKALDSPYFLVQLNSQRTMLLAAQLQGDKTAIWKWQQNLLNLWDIHSYMRVSHSAAYLATLVNRLAFCHVTQRYTELNNTLFLLESMPAESIIEQAEITHNLAYYRLLLTMNTGDWSTMVKAIATLEAVDTAHAALIPAARRLAIRYNIAIAHFVLGQPKPALKAVGQSLNLAEKQQRVDLQQAARLLQAVVHYQLGNHDLLDYLLQSLRRYLKTRQGLHAFEEALLAGLKHLLQHPQDRKATMERLLAQLDALKADPVNAQAPGLDELRLWLRAELQGKTLREVFAAQS